MPFFLRVCFFLIILSVSAWAEEPYSFEYELDPYYSNISAYFSLTNTPIPNVGERAEITIYKDMLLRSYLPRYILFEASINPLPILGVVVKSNLRDFYDWSEVSGSFNLVQSVTLGFEEPYAFSVFIGDVVNFVKPGEKTKSSNKGYMGYLVSAGNYHIKNNELIKDDWYEFEWKIKGDREFTDNSTHWSFRIGAKVHENPNITDVLYISLRRSRTDFRASPYSIFENSGFEYTYDMSSKGFAPVRHYFLVDKKWPLKRVKTAFSVAVGFILNKGRKYTGPLSEEEDSFQIIVRPNIEF